LNALLKVIDDSKINNAITVLTGDMNINLKENNNGYLNLLSEYQYVSFINVYTRLPIGFNHACLDHIFINGNDYLMTKINAGVILTDITDHCTICTSIPIITDFFQKNKMFSTINYFLLLSILANEK